jgi:hypothetical protein
MGSLEREDYISLRRWFRHALDQRKIDFEGEPMSYDANTAYDFAYYRLQAEAKAFWLNRYGYAPSDEILSRAFYDAEIERFQRARDLRHPLAWLMRKISGVIRPSAPSS